MVQKIINMEEKIQKLISKYEKRRNWAIENNNDKISVECSFFIRDLQDLEYLIKKLNNAKGKQ